MSAETGGPPIDILARPRPGRVGGGFAGGGYQGVPTFTVGSPLVERPPTARDFNLFGTLAARDSANTPALFPTATFTLPSGNVGVIRSISILANNLLVTSDVVWTLLFNEAPVFGWNRLTINPRAAGSVEVSWTPEETYIPVPENARIDFSVRVNDGGTYQVSVAVHGWMYATALHVAAEAAYLG
ncbi:MAG: hypothetical protein AB7N73_15015 [Gemmatimonadales bacterium]